MQERISRRSGKMRIVNGRLVGGGFEKVFPGRKKELFTAEEIQELGREANRVWDEIGGDCLQAIADDTGKDINRVSMSRAHVIEVVLDAGRFEQALGDNGYEDLREKWITLDYKQKIAIVKPAFPYTRYGM